MVRLSSKHIFGAQSEWRNKHKHEPDYLGHHLHRHARDRLCARRDLSQEGRRGADRRRRGRGKAHHQRRPQERREQEARSAR